MPESKIYVPCSAKEIETKHGKLLKLNMPVDELIAFLQEHKSDSGWVTLCVTERKTPSANGATHSVWLDTWKPDRQRGEAAKAQELPTSSQVAEDDIPF